MNSYAMQRMSFSLSLSLLSIFFCLPSSSLAIRHFSHNLSYKKLLIRNYTVVPTRLAKMSSTSGSIPSNLPVAVIVDVEIKEDRVGEFIPLIEADAIGSRTKENGGCLRFDVLRSKVHPNRFTFYEVYRNEDAAKFHKTTPHYKLWTDFKASGGVVSQNVVNSEALFLP